MGSLKSRAFFWFFFLSCATSFLSIILIFRYENRAYFLGERYYKSPVHLNSSIIPIRSDSGGKGFFGAPRGTNGKRRHKGLDILAALRTPVYASKSGRVAFAGWDNGYGHYIEIAHPDGLSTRYAHLSKILIRRGQWIPRGMQIGLTGRTGNALSKRILPHLHFEICHSKGAVHPLHGLLEPSLRVSS